MNNKYLEELYGWISTTDRTFNEKYTLDEFVENMDSEDYAIQMYSWISEQDPTFQDRYTVDLFVEKVKKKIYLRKMLLQKAWKMLHFWMVLKGWALSK